MSEQKIYHGDCREIIKQFNLDSFDLIMTSPPYFAGKEYEESYKTPEGYNNYITFLLQVFDQCHSVLKEGGHLWINIDDVHTSLKSIYRKSVVLPTHAILIAELHKKFDYKEMVLWKKIRGKHSSGGANRLLGSYGRFGSPGSIPIVQECEYILWFKKKGKRKDVDDDLRKKSSLTRDEFKEFGMQIWNIKPERAKQIGHPAPFPIELAERIIKLSTFKGDTILDPFMGSGTTLIASNRLGRNCIGIDKEKKYCELAQQRIDNENKQLNI